MNISMTPTMMATVYEKNWYNKSKIGKVVKITPKYIWIDRGWTGNPIIEKYKHIRSFTDNANTDRSYWQSMEYKRADKNWFEFEQNHLEEFLSNGL
jgi:hypothetical protein